jgi:hypothetical protein
MKLSLFCLNLLKAVLATTGEFEDRGEGEKPVPRKLNGEESAQRRHFNVVHAEISKLVDDERKAIVDPVEAKWKEENKKEEVENDNSYQRRCNIFLNQNPELIAQVNEINSQERDVDLTKKTWDVVKKYFVEYGDKVGWQVNDDALVEDITNKLC